MTLSLKESIQEGLIRPEMTQMLPQWDFSPSCFEIWRHIFNAPNIEGKLCKHPRTGCSLRHVCLIRDGIILHDLTFGTESVRNLGWSVITHLVTGSWALEAPFPMDFDDGRCAAVTTIAHVAVLVPWTYPQVLVLPLKLCRSPACVLCTPLAAFFLPPPLHAGSLWFLAQVMNFNSLAETFSESQISLVLKMSNWIGCQVIAGLQKPRMLTRKASVLLRAWLARETSVAPPYPEVRQPSTPCLSLWLHCEVALLSKV